jgi:acyl carrier protein
MGGIMSRNEVLEDVLKILRRYEGRSVSTNRAPLTESTSLARELDIDSARMVDIVLDVEAEFGVTIDDSKLTELQTVRDIVDVVDGLGKIQKGS